MDGLPPFLRRNDEHESLGTHVSRSVTVMIRSLNHNNSGLPDVTLSYLAMICTTKLSKQSSPGRADFCVNVIPSIFFETRFLKKYLGSETILPIYIIAIYVIILLVVVHFVYVLERLSQAKGIVDNGQESIYDCRATSIYFHHHR